MYETWKRDGRELPSTLLPLLYAIGYRFILLHFCMRDLPFRFTEYFNNLKLVLIHWSMRGIIFLVLYNLWVPIVFRMFYKSWELNAYIYRKLNFEEKKDYIVHLRTKDKTLLWYTFPSAAIKLVQDKPWTLRMKPV
jgi:hypothetical protein